LQFSKSVAIGLIERAAKLLNIQSRFTGNSGRLRRIWGDHASSDAPVRGGLKIALSFQCVFFARTFRQGIVFMGKF
jgi:hypothetical protein